MDPSPSPPSSPNSDSQPTARIRRNQTAANNKDAVENLAKLFVRLKRGKDLLAYADQHLKKDPRYDGIRALAQTAGK